jgi:glycosyltransferase involved in cell wall biosynthesis
MKPLAHALTPGDHYSPRTGSAIPTVVHGLATAARDAGDAEQSVILDASTFHPRYPSARPIEYQGGALPGTRARAVDAALARLGLPRRAAARAFRPLADAMAGEPASVVLAHNAPMLPRLLRGTPHTAVLYAHNDILRSLGHAEARRALAEVPAIVCVSRSLAAQTSSRLPAELVERVRVVENGVDTTTFTPGTAARGERLRVMFLGRAIADKGPDVVVDAAARLGRDDIEVVIVGSAGFDRAADLTPYEVSLRRRAEASRTPVTFERFVDRAGVPSLMQDADVFVVPSRWPDPSPLTVGEAMASGLAVVGSRIGGIPETLGDAGMLVAPGDPEELAAALAHLADDDSARLRLAAAARARAEERSWARSWHQLAEVLAPLG